MTCDDVCATPPYVRDKHAATHKHPRPSCSFTTQAPVPGASIVMTLVSYSTAFGSTGTEQPAGLAYILAIGWLLERCATVTNVTGDLTVTAIVANKMNASIGAEEGENDIEGAGSEKVRSPSSIMKHSSAAAAARTGEEE